MAFAITLLVVGVLLTATGSRLLYALGRACDRAPPQTPKDEDTYGNAGCVLVAMTVIGLAVVLCGADKLDDALKPTPSQGDKP